MMGRKKNRDKRKKSSESDNDNDNSNKAGRYGDSPRGHQGVSETLNVSDILSQTNSVLYETPRKPSSDTSSVFSTPVTPQADQADQAPNAPVSTVDNHSRKVLSCTPSETPHQNMSTKTNNNNECPTDKSTSNEIILMLCRIESRIGSMEKQLSKLDTLEKKVDHFDGELKRLWTHIEDKTKHTEEKVHSVEERVDGIEFASGLIQDRLNQMERERDKLKVQVTYLQSQSMRNNLIFCNIPDSEHEKPDETESKLRQFIHEKLQIVQETVAVLKIERAHRMGSYDSARSRKFVCKFNMSTDREIVRKQRVKLKNTQFYVHEQFPPEIVEKRKSLVPKPKDAVSKGKRAWISYDTLYINGKRVESD